MSITIIRIENKDPVAHRRVTSPSIAPRSTQQAGPKLARLVELTHALGGLNWEHPAMSDTTSKSEIQADQDVLWGAGEIARAIRRDPQATARLLRLDYLSATRIGDRWVASADERP